MFTPTLRRIAASAALTALWCAGFGVLVEDVLLLRQNRQLRAALYALPEVPVGKELSNLSAVSLAGRWQQISLPSSDSERLLIIAFSPGCPFCRDNRRGWLDLMAQLKRRPGWAVLWISRDPIDFTAKHLTEEDLRLCEVVADPSYRTYLQLGMAAVPSTIVVGKQGVVERIWRGRLKAADWNEIASYLKVSAPGLLRDVHTESASPGGD